MPPSTLTLKQRLANLSLATSAPSAPHTPSASSSRSSSFSSTNTMTGKRKFFNPPWMNKNEQSHICDEGEMAHRIDDVLPRMMFQAGVDFETRPMVVMNASAFPDPRTVSYDLLLTRILSYLDLFVESDYTVVFFAAGGHQTPSWNWVWKAYRSLSRKYRKNLKRLYIVHSSFFSKMLFSLAGAMISPKFFRKITYIDTLSDLASHVPLTQIDIPPPVYSENLKHEAQITMPSAAHSQMFGVSLEELMGFDGEKDGLPRVVRDCINYLRETGLEEEGLFRRSPNSVQLRQVREAYNRGHTVHLKTFEDPHLAAVLLKKFLRDLPEPIFPEISYAVIRRCPAPSDENDVAAIQYIRETLLPELAPCTLIVLSHVLLLLHEVSLRSATNRMDAHNLAIVLTPNLVASGNPLKDVAICAVAGAPEPLSPGARRAPPTPGAAESASNEGKTTLGTIIKICIQRYFEVFDELADRAEAVRTEPFSIDDAEDRDVPSSDSSSPVRGAGMHEDDDSIDDSMLAMRVGPSSPVNRRFTGGASGSGVAPSAWGVRSVAPSDSQGAARLASLGSMSKAKARSLLSPSSSTEGVTSRKGTLARGAVMGSAPSSGASSAAGTMRKASGAGVTAQSVTAAGFFSPPSSDSSLSQRRDMPPPPPQHPMSGAGPRRDLAG